MWLYFIAETRYFCLSGAARSRRDLVIAEGEGEPRIPSDRRAEDRKSHLVYLAERIYPSPRRSLCLQACADCQATNGVKGHRKVFATTCTLARIVYFAELIYIARRATIRGGGFSDAVDKRKKTETSRGRKKNEHTHTHTHREGRA